MIRVFVRNKPGRKFLQLYYDCPTTGREISKSAKTSDKSDAIKAAARWEDELRIFRGDDDSGWEWFKLRFVDEHCSRVGRGMRSCCLTALRHYQRLMNPSSVRDVTTDTLSQFAAKLAGEDRAHNGVDAILRHVLVALRFAVRVEMLPRCPQLPRPKRGKRKFMRNRPISADELKLMKAKAKKLGACWVRLLEFLDLSGFRIEEAVTASWNAPPVKADLEAKPFPCVLFYAADDAADLESGQKSGNDEVWTMPPELAAWLRQTPPGKRHGPICPLVGGTNKKILDHRQASRIVARIGAAAGIVVGQQKRVNKNGERVKAPRHAAAHDIRRGFGVRWALKVMPVVLQRLMRHSDIATTMKYYVHLDGSQIGAAIYGVSPGMSPSSPKSAV